MAYMNESFLKEAPIVEGIIPSYAMNFSESALFVCESMERSYNSLFQGIGINELAYYEENGTLIDYCTEAEEQKSLKEKVKEFFKNLWGAIKGFFEDVLKKIKEAIKENKAKMKDKIDNTDFAKIDPKTNFGKIHSYTVFDNKAKNTLKRLNSYVKSMDASWEEISDNNSDVVASQIKESGEGIVAYMIEKDGKTAEDLKNYIKGLVDQNNLIDLTYDYVKNNIGKFTDVVFNDAAINEVKEMYKLARTTIDECLSKASKSVDEAGKKQAKTSVIQAEVKVYETAAQLNTTANGAIIDVLSKKMKEYRKVVFKVKFAAAKGYKGGKEGEKKEDSVGESTDLFASQVAMVEGSFKW